MRAAVGILPLLVPAACGAPSASAVADVAVSLDEPVVLPLAEGPLPVVEVHLNGHDGLRFVVDSGSSMTVVERAQAEALGLAIKPYSHGTTVQGSAGGSVSYDGYVRARTLRAGTLTLENTHLPAVDVPFMRDAQLFGILGQDLLARLTVLVDMERRAVHLLPAGTGPEGIADYLRAAQVGDGQWVVEPVEFRPSPMMRIVGADGDVAEIKIDTGSTRTSFPDAVIHALELQPSGTVTRHGIDGPFEEPRYEDVEMQFHGFTVTLDVHRGRQEYGLLGMDVMGAFVFLLDGPGGLVWLHHRAVAPNTTGLEER